MIVCLTCRSHLIEAFQHLQHQFLVCRKCFCEFILKYNINAFNRISLLKNQIPNQVKKLQKQLLKFIDKQNIEKQDIFNQKIIDLYFDKKIKANEIQDLSTDYSLTQSINLPNQNKNTFQFYQNYNWIKQKLSTNYAILIQSKIGLKVTESMQPIKQKVIDKSNKISIGLQFLKGQLKNLQKQAPSFKQIKKIDFGGILKDKYKSLFPNNYY